MTRGASAVPAARVVKRDAEVQGDVEDGFLLAVILIGQLAVLEGDGLAFGKESDLNRVFARGLCGGGSGTLGFFVCHAAPGLSAAFLCAALERSQNPSPQRAQRCTELLEFCFRHWMRRRGAFAQ